APAKTQPTRKGPCLLSHNFVGPPILPRLAKIFTVGGMVFASLALHGQSQNPYNFSTQTILVTLPTQVTIRQGEFMYGLQGSQFVVTDNGAPQRVHLEEAPEQTGISLVVVVQCSRDAALESAKLAGLSTMIDGITGAAPHEVAVVSYGTETSL